MHDFVEIKKRSDFFSFFGIHEVKREKTTDGFERLYFKPGGFQDHIDIMFLVTDDGKIKECVLVLDREWMGSVSNVNIFARDITKSFLNDLLPKVENDIVRPIIDEIWDFDRLTNLDIYAGIKLDEESSRGTVKEFIDVFLGLKERFYLSLKESDLNIENLQDQGKEKFRLSMTFK
ncbi:MAG: hypothetical protein ACTSWN_01190 [Promethearchaeota archaeon]